MSQFPSNQEVGVDFDMSIHRFLIKSEGFDEFSLQCEMTILCLQYLTYDCFGTDLLDMQVEMYINEGYLSFQDYAASRWFQHLQAIIENPSGSLSENAAGLQRDLHRALDDFIAAADFQLDEARDTKWFEIARNACHKFKDPDLREYLVELWAQVCKHRHNPDVKERDKIGIPNLASAVERNRKSMERYGPSKTVSLQYQSFYGPNNFKCERLTCPYFYEGFETSKDRDKHTTRHDRPFQCVIETCDQSTFGFSTSKQLEKHMRSYHPETCDLTTLHAEFAPLAQRKIEGTKWVCDVCGKNFTRKINLKGHVDSHNGNKPHECPQCGRGFARKNDMVRHRKIHSKYHEDE